MVLARSSVVFTVQVVWLIVLVPGLIIGTRVYGIGGAAMAEVAVALIVVLPWYLAELGKVGIKRGPFLRRVRLPLLAAAAAALAAHAIAGALSQAFAACAVSGVLTLGVIGLLGHRLWPVVVALRATLREATTVEGGDTPPADGGGRSEVPLPLMDPPPQGPPPAEQAGPPWERARPPWELEPS